LYRLAEVQKTNKQFVQKKKQTSRKSDFQQSGSGTIPSAVSYKAHENLLQL